MNSDNKIIKIIFIIIIGIGVIYASIVGFQYLVEQEAIKSKIRDYEVLSYSIVDKKIESSEVVEKYDCRVVDLNINKNLFGSLITEAKTTTSKMTKTPTPTNNRSQKVYTSPKQNQNTVKCRERIITLYDYWIKDSSGYKYYFARGSISPNLIPNNWNNWKIGDPIAKVTEYENYFLSGIDPIFSPMQAEILSFDKNIPPEPQAEGEFETQIKQVYFVSPNQQFSFDSTEQILFNRQLMKVNSILNNSTNKKQVNLQVFLIEEGMDDYLRQVCIKRLGCNKNDLILTIQLDKSKNITRIMGYSWSPSGFDIAIELDKVAFENKMSINNFSQFESFLNLTKDTIITKFERKEMSEFKYIREELERQVKVKRNQ
jgi:hypothetical protein